MERASALAADRLHMELELEDDGRWLAEVMELPGVLVYAASREDAMRKARVLAFEALADRLKHGQNIPAAAEQLFRIEAEHA